jgi:uncharacterized protein DUF6600/FecR-like protein
MTRPAARRSSKMLALVFAGALFLIPAFAAAQEATQPAPAHISLVDGVAELERDGQTETSPSSMPVLAGDRLRTRAGRVEVLFADGSTLHLDGNTLVDFQSDDVIRLLDGRVRMNIPGPERPVEYRIDAPSAWVQISGPGEYRVAVTATRGAEVELAVLRGTAELVNEDGRTALRAGERAYASAGAAPSYAYVFNSAAWDEFDRWSELRREQRLGVSAQYLPADTRYYSATLDEYGSWNQEPTYGYVWYPRVAAGWRPYYHGRWAHLRPYGWTWIGADPWAYATHHYGRWGFSPRGWFWIPGRSWGPAWVSWAYAPGYVSWCPLGFYNKPVFSFGVNHFYGRRYDPWYAWTVVPHRSFGRGHVNVGINVINVNRIDTRVRQSFTPRDRGPEYTHYAVPRGSGPARASVGGPIVGPGAMTRATAGVAQPRVGSGISPNRDADTSFRSRASSGSQLTGPGFPAPSRQPRSAVPAIRSAPQQGSPGAVERGASANVTTAPGSERRAVPRRPGSEASQVSPGTASQPSPERSRVSPRREESPGASPSPTPDRGAVRSREVEVYRGTAIQRSNPAAPEPDVYRGRAVERANPSERPGSMERSYPGQRSMPQPEVHRGTAVPRSDPSSAPAYRSNPGTERRGPSEARPSGPPSGPPPASAAPPSRSASPRGGSGGGGGGNGGSAGPSGRSRGGQPSSGVAVRRR